MKYIHLTSHQSMITETSDELVNLAAFLEIAADIDLEDDHILIIDKVGALSLSSFFLRRDTDVLIPNKTYSEILIDIASEYPPLIIYISTFIISLIMFFVFKKLHYNKKQEMKNL